MRDDWEFEEAADFDQWLELNRAILEEMLRSDQADALEEAWMSGYQAGLDKMAEFARELLPRTIGNSSGS